MKSRGCIPASSFPLLFTLIIITASTTPSVEPPESVSPISWTTCQSKQLATYFQRVHGNYPNITRLVSIGKSAKGRDLWLLIISDSPNYRPLMRPQVKFVGNINGFSGPACYVLLRFINHLLEGFGRENSVERKLIQSNEIHILPNVNPDGFHKSEPGVCFGDQGGLNGNGIKLNRDFPDIFNPVDLQRQPETQAIMRWTDLNNFVISVSFITGALVVSYPFDTIPFEADLYDVAPPHPTPDDGVFKHLASTYVRNVNTDSTIDKWYCPSLQRDFPDGTVNGAEWMPVSGTMMDYNYVEGTFELLAGISCCRNDNNTKNLDSIWQNNKLAMLKIIEQTEIGLRGQVVDANGWAPLPQAQMRKLHQDYRLDDGTIPMPWFVSTRGEFWRPLTAGKYFIEVQAPGYKEAKIPFEIHDSKPLLLFIQLEKEEPELETSEEVMAHDQGVLTTIRPIIHDDEQNMELEMDDETQNEEAFNDTESQISSSEIESNITSSAETQVAKPKRDHWHKILKLFGGSKGTELRNDLAMLIITAITSIVGG